MLTMQQASSPRLLSSPSPVSSPKFLAHDHSFKVAGASSSSSPSASYVASSPIARSPGSGSLLKRKRPAKLCIPVVDYSLRALDTDQNSNSHLPHSSQTQVGEGYAVFSKRGRRRLMEDTFTAVTNLRGKPNQAFFGVFDGHGGREAAEFVASNLMRNILDSCSDDCALLGDAEVRLGYHKTDSDFVRVGSSSGACCLTAVIADNHVLVANAGDCRAVLVKAGGAAVQLTHDHRVSCSVERQRIESMGGLVDCYSGTWRVQGVLAVSRGIGDINLKPFVTYEPDTTRLEITSDCQLLILASDGLWDVISNQEAAECALQALERGRGSSSVLSSACQELVKVAMKRGSLDDITVLVVDLQMTQTF